MAELHTIYRPQEWPEFFGNEALTGLLQEKLEIDDLPRAILFSGPAGCGKTTLARLIAKELGCSEQNIVERNIANETGVDDMRKLLGSFRFSPIVAKGESPIKVYILDEFHRATGAAQDCLLKPLEHVPPHIYIFICTTEPNKVIKTVKSRCTHFEVQLLEPKEMMELLRWVVESEEKEVEEEVLQRIIESAEGSPRNAIKLLDKVINVKDIGQAFELINPIEEEPEVIDICRILAKPQKGMWNKIAPLVRDLKVDPEKARLAIVGYLTSIMVKDPKKAAGFFLLADSFREPLHYNGRAGLILQIFTACTVLEE